MPFADLLHASHPLVIAHRGASGEAPENTMAAFTLAVEQGARVIELDVHMSADGHPVVFHDATLERTTNGTGQVKTTTLADLRRLDAGAWFSPRFAGERISTLEEVVAWAAGRVALVIELKNDPTPYPGIEASVVGVLERHGAVEEHEVFSFNHASVRRVKAREPRLLTGVCYVADPVEHNALAAAAHATVLHPMMDYLRPEAVLHAHTAGLLVFPWTVNAPLDIQRMVAMGVDGIVTDFPRRVAELLKGH